MNRPNQTRLEIEQAIQFHLELDEELGRKDKRAWPPWVLEIYEKKGGDKDGNYDKETNMQVSETERECIQPARDSKQNIKKGWFD